MKKLGMTVVAAAAMMFSAQTTIAQETEVEAAPTEQVAQQEENFQAIEVQDLPEAVQQAVARDYATATISEVFENQNEGEKKYKIVFTDEAGETIKVYADAEGNWIEDKK